MLEAEIAKMAAERLTLRQAAERMGLTYDQFRDVRSQYPHIRWVRKLSVEQVRSIYQDKRSNRVLADVHNVHHSIISKIKSGASYGAITGAAQGRR